jgi:hypothetical protein
MKLGITWIMTWNFWTAIFAIEGIQHALSECAGYFGLAPARGLHDFWFGGVTIVFTFYGGIFLMYKTLEEAERAAKQ